MMIDYISTYSLELTTFSIDFDVKIQESIDMTCGFQGHGPDFVFAVAETWLRVENSRYLILPSLQPGNLVEEFKDLINQLSNLKSIQNLEKFMPCGGWCAWISGYWSRLNHDVSKANDEEIYELLGPLSLMESREGHIAAYIYNGKPIIEAATRSEEDIDSHNVWAEFDQGKLSQDMMKLQQSITAMIKYRVEKEKILRL